MRPGKPLSVLIVDDNRDAADTLAALLDLRGYAVRVAYHGPAAVAAARADPPDCAILDIGIPGLNGLAVARQLRADPLTRAVNLIALTGYSESEFGSRVLAAGFDHHLVKGRANPAEIEELLKMLEEIKGLATETKGLLQEAKAEFREAKAEIRETRQEVREVKEELKEVKEALKDVKEELKEIRPDAD